MALDGTMLPAGASDTCPSDLRRRGHCSAGEGGGGVGGGACVRVRGWMSIGEGGSGRCG